MKRRLTGVFAVCSPVSRFIEELLWARGHSSDQIQGLQIKPIDATHASIRKASEEALSN